MISFDFYVALWLSILILKRKFRVSQLNLMYAVFVNIEKKLSRIHFLSSLERYTTGTKSKMIEWWESFSTKYALYGIRKHDSAML